MVSEVPGGLKNNQKLDKSLTSPSTKDSLKDIPGVPEVDGVNISLLKIEKIYKACILSSTAHIDDY